MSAQLTGVMWLPLGAESVWPTEIRRDGFLYPQLNAIRGALAGDAADSRLPAT